LLGKKGVRGKQRGGSKKGFLKFAAEGKGVHSHRRRKRVSRGGKIKGGGPLARRERKGVHSEEEMKTPR